MFIEALQFTLLWEGGFSNVKDDRGGPTYKGVTQETCNQWCQATGQHYRLCSSLLQTDIEAIYRDLYWLKAGCDRLPWPLAMAVFDCAVHSGPYRSVKLLQRACGVKEDGIIGPLTLAVAAKVNPLAVVAARRLFLEYLIEKDPSQQKFEKGWMNRLNELERKLRAHPSPAEGASTS